MKAKRLSGSPRKFNKINNYFLNTDKNSGLSKGRIFNRFKLILLNFIKEVLIEFLF